MPRTILKYSYMCNKHAQKFVLVESLQEDDGVHDHFIAECGCEFELITTELGYVEQ